MDIGLLAAGAQRVMCRLGATAVTIYLPTCDQHHLQAAAVAVSPRSVALPELVRADDPLLPMSTAFNSGQTATGQSVNLIGRHPSLADFAQFPFTITAFPLIYNGQCLGIIGTLWDLVFHELKVSEVAFARNVAEQLAAHLHATPVGGDTSDLPRVAPWEQQQHADTTGQSELYSSSEDYHLWKLSTELAAACNITEAAKAAVTRIAGAFQPFALILSLVEGGRLRAVGGFSGSNDMAHQLKGRNLDEHSLETQALTGREFRELKEEDERLGARWRVVLPLLAAGEAIGACTMIFNESRLRSRAERSAFMSLSSLLGSAFARTVISERDASFTRGLQQTLLPMSLPPVAGMATTTRYLTALSGMQMGGDWYDFMRLPDGYLGAVIGDVEGHSTTSAIVMGQLRSAVRAFAGEGHPSPTVLERVNRLLLDLGTDLLATCCFLRINPSNGYVSLSNAGHLPPLVRLADGSQPGLNLHTGQPLGVSITPDYRATDLHISPGTMIVLYTDGLTHPGEQFPKEIIDLSVAQAGEDLEALADLLTTAGSSQNSRADDAALMIMRYDSPPTKECAVGEIILRRRDTQSVRLTRKTISRWLTENNLESLEDTAVLLASEVVTNALIHADSEVQIILRKNGPRLRILVSDYDTHLAELVETPRAEDQAEHGRGLMIVSALATKWGNSPNGKGKTVWFDITPATQDTVIANQMNPSAASTY